jgi:intein-encoded DNA endonuclease-like protein
VKIPIEVHIDNVGVIWLANNRTTSERTKHVQIRENFVREFLEDGKISIIFVRSKDNDSDIFTKNTTKDIFCTHQQKMIIDKKEISEKQTKKEEEE